MKYLEILTLLSILASILITLKYAYGLAGSLANLQSESKSELDYRTQLDDYIISHNITCCLKFNEMDDYQLESIVEQHMKDCQSGQHDRMINETKNMTSGIPSLLQTEKEILGSYGNC